MRIKKYDGSDGFSKNESKFVEMDQVPTNEKRVLVKILIYVKV